MIVVAIFALIIVLIVWAILPRYNRLYRLKNAVNRERSNVLVQLQRRHDLVDNLAELVHAYTVYESVAIPTVIAQRYREGGALRLLALAEQYPNLKADSNYLQLSRDLRDTENRISIARSSLNEAAKQFNDMRNTFPDIILLGWLFKAESYFQGTSDMATPFSAERHFSR